MPNVMRTGFLRDSATNALVVTGATGGGGTDIAITGVGALGETLTCAAPDGSTFQWLRNGTTITGATSSTYVLGALDQGKDITCAVTIVSNAISVAGEGLVIASFGDSFWKGLTDGLSSQAMRIPTQVATMLDAGEATFAVGGARQFLNDFDGSHPEILTQVLVNDGSHPLPSSAPYAPVWSVATMQVSINNLNRQPVIDDMSIMTDAVLRGVRRLRASGSYEAHSFPYTLSSSPAWTKIDDTTASSGGGFQRAFANGATWQLAVPSDFPGGVLRPFGPKVSTFGGVETFTKDGSAAGSIDNTDATYQGEAQSWQHEITLTAGAHTVHSTVSSISSVENFNGCDFETATVPLVVVVGTSRAPTYPGAEHTTTDTDVLTSNTAVQAMLAAEFGAGTTSGDGLSIAYDSGRVIFFHMDKVLAPGGTVDHTLFGPDQIHPNDAGATAVATALASTIAAALA